jgi:hypothetical protein
MAEAAKAEEVLEIIPGDAAKSILAEKSGDDDAHGSEAVQKVGAGHAEREGMGFRGELEVFLCARDATWGGEEIANESFW